MEVKKIFAERLRACRSRKGVTQRAVAEYLGLKTLAYQRYELSERFPNVEGLVKLADYFEVSTDYLLGRSETP